jgi:hypothetical protein
VDQDQAVVHQVQVEVHLDLEVLDNKF